jgi:hypothetical protein
MINFQAPGFSMIALCEICCNLHVESFKDPNVGKDVGMAKFPGIGFNAFSHIDVHIR